MWQRGRKKRDGKLDAQIVAEPSSIRKVLPTCRRRHIQFSICKANQTLRGCTYIYLRLSLSLRMCVCKCAHTRRTSLRRKKTQAEARSVNCSCGLPREIPQPKATIPIGYMYSLFGSAGRRQHFKIMYMFKIFLSQGEKSYENFIAYPKGEKWEESIR